MKNIQFDRQRLITQIKSPALEKAATGFTAAAAEYSKFVAENRVWWSRRTAIEELKAQARNSTDAETAKGILAKIAKLSGPGAAEVGCALKVQAFTKLRQARQEFVSALQIARSAAQKKHTSALDREAEFFTGQGLKPETTSVSGQWAAAIAELDGAIGAASDTTQDRLGYLGDINELSGRVWLLQ